MCLEPCSGFLADAAIQSEVQKIILPKYGISQIQALSLQRLTETLIIPDITKTSSNNCLLFTE